MYKKSIKENSQYIIPFIEGIKYYGSDEIVKNVGTMIILNENGDILTCKHIAMEFLNNISLVNNYGKLIDEISKAKNTNERKKIERKHKIDRDTVVLSDIILLLNSRDEKGKCEFEVFAHEYLDIAVIRFKNVHIKASNYPIFSKKLPEQGQSVCRLGYAFPEYDIFEYDTNKKQIVLKDNKVLSFPLFPLDGIVTRLVVDQRKRVSSFETSSPGLRGQSGGPIFGPDGTVYGIQCFTKHMDLNFDVKTIAKRGFKEKKIEYTPFINLGVGISSVEIIKFLKENSIDFCCK